MVYYNEIDPFAAQWLRNLIAKEHLANGDVDERSIHCVHPSELLGYKQCHFFAGLGAWSHALRLASWPDDKPVWTGSCPCQPFSIAGKRKGTDDNRHLWPEFYRLISALRPNVIFGEQVASRDGLAWLDIVCADLEAAGYAVGAVDTCAAGFGAPHIRQRLYFVADSQSGNGGLPVFKRGSRPARSESEWGSKISELADFQYAEGHMGDASGEGLQGWGLRSGQESGEQAAGTRGATNGFWRDAEWLPCIDGKARAVEPSTFPLAYGVAARVGRLRAYGNAIVAPQAEAFIKAYMECRL